MSARRRAGGWPAVLGRLSLAAALLSGIVAALAGLGHRWGFWTFATGFDVLRWATIGALATGGGAILLMIVFAARRAWRGLLWSGLAFAVALPIAAVPLLQVQRAQSLPPIHDITTDTADPPAFVEILPLRRAAPNLATYGGADVAAQQAEAYPDIAPLTVPLAPDRALATAAAVAKDLGWTIVALDPDAGRLEATAETLWFGFKDDVVVRVRPTGDGSRIDARSVSRVGRSDIGANAKRLRIFLAEMSAASDAGPTDGGVAY